ncbi:MAG: beta-N-acetylhexosaminidase [Hyphomicrobium sp.]|nr:beta-N-acetylhexosaminidase [Hyphomicrobium sp.]
MPSAFITGLAGPTLLDAERSFLAASRPAGIILFARNCVSREQIRKLIGDSLDAIGNANALVLIDQEGGRVQRLRPPLGRALPPAAAFGTLYAHDPVEACRLAFLVSRQNAEDLRALGINTNCAPVLDVPVPGAHDVIGNRAYGATVDQVAALGAEVAAGLMAGGVLPVMKHIPGHGRAGADSHYDLPVVNTPRATLEATDFAPFRALAHLPAAMTAHVLLTDIDRERPASTSLVVTAEIIRGSIGFGGLLMSDDVSMKALGGPLGARAEAVLAAGSDLVLHCNGIMAEMEAVAAASPEISGASGFRLEAALAVLQQHEAFEPQLAEAAIARALSVSA